jgi:hypothetical protein
MGHAGSREHEGEGKGVERRGRSVERSCRMSATEGRDMREDLARVRWVARFNGLSAWVLMY